MAAVRATLEVMEREDVPGRAAVTGEYLASGLARLPGVSSVRGAGLLRAAVLAHPFASALAAEALRDGLVVNAPRPDVLRLAPSLLVTTEEVDQALAILRRILTRLTAVYGLGRTDPAAGSPGPGSHEKEAP
jgi:acetylornithine aminotransferase